MKTRLRTRGGFKTERITLWKQIRKKTNGNNLFRGGDRLPQ
jgi:hypothetical protein